MRQYHKENTNVCLVKPYVKTRQAPHTKRGRFYSPILLPPLSGKSPPLTLIIHKVASPSPPSTTFQHCLPNCNPTLSSLFLFAPASSPRQPVLSPYPMSLFVNSRSSPRLPVLSPYPMSLFVTPLLP